ncbi:hypothetical protein [Hymenobacter arizonensis]|uniref:Outer membrane protein beta-barrel domain-containing protein n=1 Tax=Hymenobacter arizonensis TaxID=1227077 RepID=A0A1I5XTM5_HYMAR|nr:hypothetical protein [Hymenobacter arizonensis]SFQ35323.1 hypothetical protein SAMN04515668_2036 [Hymenobacter arizonensis]
MRIVRFLLPGALLLATTALSHGQTTPATPPTPEPTQPEAADEAGQSKMLFKVGLNAGRAFQWGGFAGWRSQVPVTLGTEYALSPKFTLYGQLDTDFGVLSRPSYSGERSNLVPSGALGLGGRYYYNQKGRALQNRAHGRFIGNYLGLELHTEMRRLYGRDIAVAPALNAVWGMQRRLSPNFLFDFNAGVGLGPNRNYTTLAYRPGPLTLTTQFNLGLYFGR